MNYSTISIIKLNNKIFSVIIFMFLNMLCSAQNNWELTIPSKNVSALEIIAEQKIILGIYGSDTLQLTNDNGNSWQQIPLSFTPAISGINNFDFYFIDTLNGWVSVLASGYVPYIFKTNDGGNTWSQIYTNSSSANLNQIYFKDQNIGWALNGWVGEVWKTTDGGYTWNIELTASANGAYPNSIEFVDANNGFIAGYNCVFKTTNGGATWQEYTHALPIIDIHFFTPQHGLSTVFLQYGELYETFDAGATWSLKYTDSNLPQMHDLYFLDANNGFWIGGTECRHASCHPHPAILYTTDGGISWNSQNHNASIDYVSFNEMSFSPSGFGWMASEEGPLKLPTQIVSVSPKLKEDQNSFHILNSKEFMVVYPHTSIRGANLTIYNLIGKKIYEQRNVNEPVHISSTIFSSGIFIVNLSNNEISISQKIVLN